MNSTIFTSPEVIENFFYYSVVHVLFSSFFVVETILLQCLITCAEIRSRFPLELNSKTFTSFIMPNFVEFSVLFRIVCSFILFITSCVILRKQEAAILKSSAPAIFTLHKLIIVRYDAIPFRAHSRAIILNWVIDKQVH